MTRQSCCSCQHPMIKGYSCPLCGGMESVEVCDTCGTTTVKPPGAEESFCQNCVLERMVSTL